MKTVRVGDISDQIRGVTYSKADARQNGSAGFSPILRAGNIGEFGLVYDDLVFVPDAKISEKQRIRRHDVVIATSSGSLDVVGKAAQASDNFSGGFGAFCKVLRPGEEVDPKYFGHFFRTGSYRRTVAALAAGANINNLRTGHLDDLEIPLPPLPEQKRIAAILDAADALRAKRRESLEQLDKLVQSVFLDMFGDPVTNPKGWRITTIEEIAETGSGTTPSRARRDEYYEGGMIPWVKSGELRETLITGTEENVTNAALEGTSLKLVPPGSVLIAMYGATVGRMAMLAVPATTNQAVCHLIPDEQHVLPSYLYWSLLLQTEPLISMGKGGAQPNISQKIIRDFPLMIPPLQVQAQFGQFLAKWQKLYSNVAQHLAELDTLFASLQSRAFRGEL